MKRGLEAAAAVHMGGAPARRSNTTRRWRSRSRVGLWWRGASRCACCRTRRWGASSRTAAGTRRSRAWPAGCPSLRCRSGRTSPRWRGCSRSARASACARAAGDGVVEATELQRCVEAVMGDDQHAADIRARVERYVEGARQTGGGHRRELGNESQGVRPRAVTHFMDLDRRNQEDDAATRKRRDNFIVVDKNTSLILTISNTIELGMQLFLTEGEAALTWRPGI
ncbi:hypothetical protein EJB05_44810, partial [Eragrostis curvula]